MSDQAWRDELQRHAADWIAGHFGDQVPSRLLPFDVEAIVSAAQDSGVFKPTETEPLLVLQEWAEATGWWHNPGEGYEPSPGDIAVFRCTTGVVTLFEDEEVEVIVSGDDPGEVIGIIDTSLPRNS